jgi:hypothetical protein
LWTRTFAKPSIHCVLFHRIHHKQIFLIALAKTIPLWVQIRYLEIEWVVEPTESAVCVGQFWPIDRCVCWWPRWASATWMSWLDMPKPLGFVHAKTTVGEWLVNMDESGSILDHSESTINHHWNPIKHHWNPPWKNLYKIDHLGVRFYRDEAGRPVFTIEWNRDPLNQIHINPYKSH